jgi:Fe-S-cluster-containing dehydrogenase component/anaerobic selenocysteine-containing dehydrogenase
MDRRDFLKLIGVASGTSMLAGCNLDRQTEKLIPYLVPPEDGVIPGDAIHVPSTCTECPAACGLSVTVKEGRPTKLEGLPSHPASDGSLCVRGQASLSRLYHPERIRQPLVRDSAGELAPTDWNRAYEVILGSLDSGGEDVFIGARTTGSLSALIGEFCQALGISRLPDFELYPHAAVREANRLLFGRAVEPTYRIDEADFLLTIGADVLDTYDNPVEYTRQVTRAKAGGHFGWWHVEPHASLTSLHAEHSLTVVPGSEAHLLAWLLRELYTRRIYTDGRIERHLAAVPEMSVDEVVSATGLERDDLEYLINSFFAARHPLVIVGGAATRTEGGLGVALLGALLQAARGMIGTTVDFGRAFDFSGVGTMADIESLGEKLDAGGIGVIFVAGTDPVAQLPAVFRFGERLSGARLRVGMGDTFTETMKRCDVVLPLSHSLEAWGDSRPKTGLVSVVQPVIEPIHDTRSMGDILLQLMGEGAPAESFQVYLLNRWKRDHGAAGTDALITKGFLVESEMAPPGVSLVSTPPAYAIGDPVNGSVLMIVPSLRFFDGRSKVLPLLNEIPDPMSSVTWDGWVSVAKKTAEEMGLKNTDWVELSSGEWSAELPVQIQPGMHEGVFMVEEGTVPSPAGWDRKTGEARGLVGIGVRKIPSRGHLSHLSGSKRLESKGHIPLEHIPHHHAHVEGIRRENITFFPVPNYPEYRWAMAIDLDRCTACSACVAACYIENNVPVVGREEHMKGREMSWITMQPYYNDDESGEIIPMLCQHCDNAPCEPVCPVFATYHNDEGLNAQVYNRCVGTRYCSNNCPYKVRRFNWFANNKPPEPLEMMHNPDVSVRSKGIMEKCSFCVQRIRKARDVAKDEDRKIGADEVVPACAQTCPGDAIVFGNIKDENSKVARWAQSEDTHQALGELGTGPAVYYLKRGVKGYEHG